MDDAETIERALTRVLGYVDPVAHALATKAAARDETTIAAALKNVLDRTAQGPCRRRCKIARALRRRVLVGRRANRRAGLGFTGPR